MPRAELRHEYAKIQQEARQLGGRLCDLEQRATVYHHLFLDSGRNHCFSLIAAHGALWAGGYFQSGTRLAKLLAMQYFYSHQRRREQLQSLSEFADVFRDINRRVCIDAYTNYHFMKRFGDERDVESFVPPRLVVALRLIHDANRAGRELSAEERREVFRVHFLHEQDEVVAPVLDAAVPKFNWPLVKALALRPRVQFAYFPQAFRFRNFADKEERIERGLQAYDYAASAGWTQVEAALRSYNLLPPSFFTDARRHFAETRHQALAPEMGDSEPEKIPV